MRFGLWFSFGPGVPELLSLDHLVTRYAKSLIVVAAAAVIGGAFLFWGVGSEPLKIDFVGYTNHFRGIGREAVIALTNKTDAPLVVTLLPERKNPEWPIHEPTVLNGNVNPDLILPGRGATNFLVRLQPNDGVWRVRVFHRPRTLTGWQITRNRWAAHLLIRKWDRLAAFVMPSTATVVLTPEMQL